MNTAVALLLALYAWIVVMNAAVMFLLWRGSKVQHYRDMTIVWLLGAVNFFVGFLFSQADSFTRLLSFSTTFFFYYFLSGVLARLANLPIKSHRFILIHGCAVALAIGLNYLESINPVLVALPISISAGLPCLVIGALSLKRIGGKSSIAMKGFAVTLILEGLHAIDYAIFYRDVNLVVIGFTIGLAITVALTLFGPGVIVETVTREKVELELSLLYKAKMSNDIKLLALGEMAAGVAHEINNPLASIQLSLDQFKRSMSSDAGLDLGRVTRNYEVINKQTQRISFIVRSLLDFTYEESKSNLQHYGVSKLMEGTLSFYQEKFRLNEIDFTVMEVDPNLTVLCRPSEISQVIRNLLNNAFDAAREATPKWIRIEIQTTPEDVQILISNSGEKIPEDIQDKIFQPFFTTKEVGKSIGLGLSISKGIANSHGGDLRYLPEKPGTCFELRLPRV